MDAQQGASRKNEAQENSAVVEPMIVQLDLNKKRAKAFAFNKLTRKRVRQQASKAYLKIANLEKENKQLQKKVHKYRKAAYKKSINASSSDSPSPNSSHTPSSLDRKTEEISSENVSEVNI